MFDGSEFFLKEHNGKAILNFSQKKIEINLTLDIKEKKIIADYTQDRQKISQCQNVSPNFKIENIEINFNSIILKKQSIDNFFISDYKLSDNGINQEIQIEITPVLSEINFSLEKSGSNHIFFNNIYMTLFQDSLDSKVIFKTLNIEKTKKKFMKTIYKDIHNEKDFKNCVYLAITLAQGAQPDYVYHIINNKIFINLFKSDFDNPFFLIPEENFSLFFDCFYEFWQGLEDNEKKLYERAINMFVYAKSKLISIESKLILLFTPYEIFDEKPTMRDEKIFSKIFNISRFDAKFIQELRNILVHKGEDIITAINLAFEESKKLPKEEIINNQSIIKKVIPDCKANEFNFQNIFFALLYIFDRFLLDKIKYNKDYYNAINFSIEKNTNEILIKDKELLEELKRR